MSKNIAAARSARNGSAAGLVRLAVESLRQRILRDEFGPNGCLPSQGELANELGISRPVVREAMQVLQSQGLLEISQGKRPQVKPANPQALIGSLKDLLARSDVTLLNLAEARVPLESEIAALAAERARPGDLASLRDSIEEQRRARSLEARVEADVGFHRALARATGNPVFDWLLETLASLLRESRRRTIQESGADVPIDHHTRILRAVERRDAAEARRAMLDHLHAARGDIERSAGKRSRRA